MRLDNFAREFTDPSNDDGDKSIDYSAAGLYIPAAQTILATVVTAGTSVLACWLIPTPAISAVRTLTLTAASGFIVIRKPIKVGNTKGLSTIFSALRPCCFIYVFCLVLEQLIHTCIAEEATYENGFWRRVIYHGCMTILIIAGFLRSKNPRSESDIPFAISTLALLVVAALPPPALALSGPLCSPATLATGAERLVRAFVFSTVYVVLVYSAAPLSNHIVDTFVCIARSAAASTWVLGSVIFLLPLALAQVALVLYCSFALSNLEYDSVALPTGDLEASKEEVKQIRIATQSPTTEIAAISVDDVVDRDVSAALNAFKVIQKPTIQCVDGKGLTFTIPHAMTSNGLIGIE
jgi:hypothetical protein